ncbi:MAG: hypothetical protein F6K08_01090 [Okeania sp. SIO1H6]|nr:hypothetical protein [Okeania sp. SIO1H6]
MVFKSPISISQEIDTAVNKYPSGLFCSILAIPFNTKYQKLCHICFGRKVWKIWDIWEW